jgi:hypothetical protein
VVPSPFGKEVSLMKTALTSRQKRLRLSIAGFGVLGALLSLGLFIGLFVVQARIDGVGVAFYTNVIIAVARPATVAMTLTSMLCWWLFIVRPARLTLRRGVLAGIVSPLCAIPLTVVFVLYWSTYGLPTSLSSLVIVPYVTYFSFVVLFFPAGHGDWYWCIGWITLLMGGSAGGLFALLLRSTLPVTDPA